MPQQSRPSRFATGLAWPRIVATAARAEPLEPRRLLRHWSKINFTVASIFLGKSGWFDV
jgi:hypothetical protein